MKIYSRILAIASAFCLLAAPVLAQAELEGAEEGMYVFLNAGAGLALHACASQNDPNAGTCHGNYPVVRAGFGYQYTPMWGVEASYGQFGYAYSDGYSAAFPTPPGPGNYAWEMKVTGLAVHVVGTMHLTDELAVVGKVGLARLEFDESLKVASASGNWYAVPTYNEKRNTLALAAGVRYDLTRRASISALVESYGTHDVYNLGLGYRIRLTVLPVISLRYAY